MDFCEHPEISTDNRKKVKFVLNGNPTLVSSQNIAGIPRLNELIEIGCKALNIKSNNNDWHNIRIFRCEGVELFEEDLKYLKQNEILYVSPNNEEFDDSNNFAMYKLLQKVGKGGFGSVFEAKHRITKEKIAIKMIHGSNIRSAKDIEMMFKEIGLLKNLYHRNIIKVMNCYTLKSQMKLAIVLEFLEGGDLREFLEKQPSQFINEEMARKIFLQLFSAIQYCHREKIIHRDLKLENIMFTNKNFETIKVVDFGISAQQSLINVDYTQAGSVRYFAPEVLSTKAPAHPSIDIWAMGCILYWMIVGQSPFPQNTKEEVFSHILKGKYTTPAQVKSRVTKSVIDLINKMLQVDINKRITMTEMAQHPWLRSTVDEIKEIEMKEAESQLQSQKCSKFGTVQQSSATKGLKFQKLPMSNSNNNTRTEFTRKKEGTKSIINSPSVPVLNPIQFRKNSLNLIENEKQQGDEDISPKPDTQRYQILLDSYQKKLQKKKLPMIKEQNTLSSQKKIQSQRVIKVCKDKPQSFSTIEQHTPSNPFKINSPSFINQMGGILTPKQMNTPTPIRSSILSSNNMQQQNNYKTPNQQQKETLINENNYSINKSYNNNNNNQMSLQNRITSFNNLSFQQNEVQQLRVNNNFNNIHGSQKKQILYDKISPLQSPTQNKNNPQSLNSLQDIHPNLLRKNDAKFSQQKLIQITNNAPSSNCDLDITPNVKFINLNVNTNNLQFGPKHRNSNLFIQTPSQQQLGQIQDNEQENQMFRYLSSKKTKTHL